MNVAELLRYHARVRPAASAILHADGSATSYASLAELSGRIACVLVRHGVRAGDRVALALPNGESFVLAYLGALWAGATVVSISAAWAPADQRHALETARARLVVADEATVLALGLDDRDVGVLLDGALRAECATSPPLDVPVARRDQHVASILFSSGTTGAPKGVMLTHANLRFNALAKASLCGMIEGDVVPVVVPLSHCFGQNVALLAAMAAGAAVRVPPRFDVDDVLERLGRAERTVLFAPPPAFARLLASGSASLRHVRVALSAAAPLPADTARGWNEATERALHQGYGLTESSPFAAFTFGEPFEEGVVGRAIPGVELRVVGESGDALPAGVVGEVCVRGPNVMHGYWRREGEARHLGWLRTGDLGAIDARGRLHLGDRVDDVVNVSGFKVHPCDVERALRAVGGVRDAVAFGVPDARRGAAVHAAVVADEHVDVETVLRAASERLGGFQRPSRVHRWNEIPRSPAGKIDRRALAAQALATVAAP